MKLKPAQTYCCKKIYRGICKKNTEEHKSTTTSKRTTNITYNRDKQKNWKNRQNRTKKRNKRKEIIRNYDSIQYGQFKIGFDEQRILDDGLWSTMDHCHWWNAYLYQVCQLRTAVWMGEKIFYLQTKGNPINSKTMLEKVAGVRNRHGPIMYGFVKAI